MKPDCCLKEKLTLLVCSCDSYEDLWTPFFTLLKKYWSSFDLQIVFNTETKSVSFDDLDIKCVHSPSERRYGQRLLNALSCVKTEYVLLMLDDFFLRSPVCEHQIQQIISWMNADRNIACFNCEALPTYVDFEINKYPGFKRIPPANNYTLNMQAAIWRTKTLEGYWHPEPSPWEWENFYNLLTLQNPQHKFYCAISPKTSFVNYGHYASGDIWGVYRGKWIIEDVGPLFEKENIKVDFSIRGIYSKNNTTSNKKNLSDVLKRCRLICKLRSGFELPLYFSFEIYRIIRSIIKHPTDSNYITYILDRERKRFMNTMTRDVSVNSNSV